MKRESSCRRTRRNARYFCIIGRKRAMTATAITIPLIGRRKNMVQSFWKLIIVVMKEFSAIGPRIEPKTIGAMGNLILSKMYPTIPNATMSQRSDKLFRIERAPIKQRSMIKAETIDSENRESSREV